MGIGSTVYHFVNSIDEVRVLSACGYSYRSSPSSKQISLTAATDRAEDHRTGWEEGAAKDT
jgi:hypothetical protein